MKDLAQIESKSQTLKKKWMNKKNHHWDQTLPRYSSLRSQNLDTCANYKIKKAPDDGHCMIHTWKIALGQSSKVTLITNAWTD